MKIKDKLKKIVDSKYFIPCFVIAINAIFFIACNILFELRYETVDDFTIMKIISKLDGSYSIYSVYIHPILSFIIMMLFKTGININWYTITLLLIQFISFTTIGIILLNKNKKVGTIFYLIIISVFYSKLLIIINYTSIAAIAILAGVVAILYYIETNSKKSEIAGLILIAIGTMLRQKSLMIVLPFYMMYTLYYTIKNKNIKALKMLLYIIIIFIIIYVSHLIIYKSNPVYDKYMEFNDIRTYFFDSNVLNYEKDKEILKKSGWSFADYRALYTYSLADEDFYTTENLQNLKENIHTNLEDIKDKAMSSLEKTFNITKTSYISIFIGICILLLLSIIIKKERIINISFFIMFILLNYVLIYMKPTYRTLIPLYATAFIMMSYVLTREDLIEKNAKGKIENILLIFIAFFYMFIDSVGSIYTFKFAENDSIQKYSNYRDIVAYTNEHKENAYVYPNVFLNISQAYSIYEKIDDDTFSNLRFMSDWDIYDQEYYNFKERYNLDNIMEDLYKKDNLYIITGKVITTYNTICNDHIEIIKQYIKEHYNKDVEYDVVKEFPNSIKIYKIYEKK